MICFCNIHYRNWSNCYGTHSKRKRVQNELIRQLAGQYAWAATDHATPNNSPLQRLHHFKYRQLKSATKSFSDKRILGRGAFGVVYRGVLNNGTQVAVKKLIDQQGEREFQNELAIAGCLDSPYVVKLLGFCTRGKRVRLLVYECMENGSLQDALFNKRDSAQQTASTSSSLLGWGQRLRIITEIAQALELLHLHNPPIIHGDIKPSNVLLDKNLSARIADFGLARFKTADLAASASISPDMNAPDYSPPEIPDMGNPSINTDQHQSLSNRELNKYLPSSFGNNNNKKPPVGEMIRQRSVSKSYVLDWLGKELEAANHASQKNNMASEKGPATRDNNQFKHSSEDSKTKQAPRKKREWWKDEYFAELESKSKSRHNIQLGNKYFNDSMDFLSGELRKPDNRSILDGCRSQSHEWMRSSYKSRMRVSSISNDMQLWSGELNPSTGELVHHQRQWSGDLSIASTTTSMRGTVCYVAPEYGGLNNALPSEKCDIYSFGVLMLVIISGRRPIQISGSRPTQFERAILISWARTLAQSGNLLDLMDERLGDQYNKQQANLCIKLAMRCLQRVPDNRPDISQVLKVLLTGEI